MIYKTAKAPTALLSGDALGIAQCLAACNPEATAPLSQYQTNFVARRTRLRPELASVIAGLAFDRRAA